MALPSAAGSRIEYGGMSTEALIELANDAACQVESHGRKTVQSAMIAGRSLLEMKQRVEHGEWAAFLKAHWLYSVRHAQTYMRLAKSADSALLESAGSVSEALLLLADRSGSESPDDVPEPSQEASPVAGEAVAERGVPEPQQSLTDDCSRPPAAVARRPREPRQADAPRLTDEQEFHLGERLDADREAILAMAGDYLAARQGKHFVALLKKLVIELGGA